MNDALPAGLYVTNVRQLCKLDEERHGTLTAIRQGINQTKKGGETHAAGNNLVRLGVSIRAECHLIESNVSIQNLNATGAELLDGTYRNGRRGIISLGGVVSTASNWATGETADFHDIFLR